MTPRRVGASFLFLAAWVACLVASPHAWTDVSVARWEARGGGQWVLSVRPETCLMPWHRASLSVVGFGGFGGPWVSVRSHAIYGSDE